MRPAFVIQMSSNSLGSAPAAYQITVTKNAKVYPLTSSTPNVPVPGTPAVGDLIFMAVGVTARTPVTWPAGFTGLQDVGPPTSDKMAFAVRVADGTESGTFTGTLTGGSGDWISLGVLVHVPGVTLSMQSNDAVYFDQGGVATGTPLALDGPNGTATTVANSLVLLFMSISSGGETGSITTLTLPSGFALNDIFEDGISEMLLCASKTIATATTADYDTTVVMDVGTGAHLLSFNGAIVITGGGPPAPTPMGFTGTLPGGTVGVPYSAFLTITGDFVSPLTLDYAAGSLPAWETATINESLKKVTFSGTPTTAETETFTPRLTDSTSGTPQVVSAPGQSVVIAAGGGSTAVLQTKPLSSVTGAGWSSWSIIPDAPFTLNNLVVVHFGYYRDAGAADVTAMKCNGVAMTRATFIQTDDGGTHVFQTDIWRGYAGNTIANGGAGPDGISATLAGTAAGYIKGKAIELTGAAASSPLGPTNTATGHSTAPAVGITPSQAKMFIVTSMVGENNATDTITVPASPWIEAYLDSDGSSEIPVAGAYEDVNSTSPLTATYTYAAARDWVACIASFKIT